MPSKAFPKPLVERTAAVACTRCAIPQPPGEFPTDRHRPDWKSSHCRACQRILSRESRLKLRTKVLAIFGSICGNCGFDDVRALQVHHVHGGGHQHRKALKSNQAAIMRAIQAAPQDYELLCANCHAIETKDAR
jgi:hypothetical protein